jgi:hypothetical protein
MHLRVGIGCHFYGQPVFRPDRESCLIHLRLLPGVHSAFRFSDAISPGLSATLTSPGSRERIKQCIEFCDGSGTLIACMKLVLASCHTSNLSIGLRYFHKEGSPLAGTADLCPEQTVPQTRPSFRRHMRHNQCSRCFPKCLRAGLVFRVSCHLGPAARETT